MIYIALKAVVSFSGCHAGETLQVDSLPLCVCSFRSNLAGPSPFSIHAHMAGQGDFWNHMVLFPHLLFKFQTFTYTLHDPPQQDKSQLGSYPFWGDKRECFSINAIVVGRAFNVGSWASASHIYIYMRATEVLPHLPRSSVFSMSPHSAK